MSPLCGSRAQINRADRDNEKCEAPGECYYCKKPNTLVVANITPGGKDSLNGLLSNDGFSHHLGPAAEDNSVADILRRSVMPLRCSDRRLATCPFWGFKTRRIASLL